MIIPDLKKEFDVLMQKCLRPQAALLPLLHKMNENNEFPDEEKIDTLSQLCQVTPVAISELAREVSEFGQSSSVNLICMDLPCYINGADEIYEKQAGSIAGEKQSLEEFQPSRCLGYCYLAPAVLLDDGTACQIKKLLNSLLEMS